MSKKALAVAAGSSLGGFLKLAFWVCLVGIIVIGRLHTYDEPLEQDIGIYATLGHGILQGHWLYTDLWDHKPPGVALVFALFELFFGYGPLAIFALSVVCALITLVGVYQAVKIWTKGNEQAAFWAAGLWSLLSLNLDYQANQPNVEVLINAVLIWILVIYLRSGNRLLPWGKVVAVGLMLGLATMFKQIAVFIFLGLAVVHVLAGLKTGDVFKRSCQAGLVLVLVGAMWGGGMFGVLFARRLD